MDGINPQFFLAPNKAAQAKACQVCIFNNLLPALGYIPKMCNQPTQQAQVLVL